VGRLLPITLVVVDYSGKTYNGKIPLRALSVVTE